MKIRILSLILAMSLCFGVLFTGQIVSAAKVRGDLNKDGVIDIKDCLILKKSISNDETDDELDCNGDGNVSVDDVYTMIDYLAKDGSLFVETDKGWNNLYNWEGVADGTKPASSVTTISVQAPSTFLAKSLRFYSVKNDKSPESQTALALVSAGHVTQPNEDYVNVRANGTNPTTGQMPASIRIDTNKIKSATNMRVLLNMVNKESEIDIIYVGFMMNNGKRYYHKIDKEAYAEFNYFYFADKEYTEFSAKRRTFLEDDKPNVMTLTKDDVKNIRNIYFWLESSSSNGSPLIIDDIDYFEEPQGYDSSAEDAALPKPAEPVNDGKDKYICVSFDDGPQKYAAANREYMEYYMDLANEYNAKNTFFLIGNNFGDEDVDTLNRAIKEGHEIENHTWGHPDLTSLEASAIQSQVSKVDEWLSSKLTGFNGTNFVRLPFLKANSTVYSAVNKVCISGYCPNDYDRTSVDYRIEYYKKHLKDGSVVLAHENYIDNVETLRRLYEYFGKQGYKFVTINEMFKIKGVTPEKNKQYSDIG